MIVIIAFVRLALHANHAHRGAAQKNPQFIDYVGKVR